MAITHVTKHPMGEQEAPVEITLHITVDSETSVDYTFDEDQGFTTEIFQEGIHQRSHVYTTASANPTGVYYLNVYETGSPSTVHRMYQHLSFLPPEPEAPPVTEPEPEPETPTEVSAIFSKTTDHGGGGGSSTVTFGVSIPDIDGVAVDDFALAIIPVLEDADYDFEHIQVKTTVYSTYDPRNP